MKIIDLLNKIANGEEVPDAIKFNDIIYKKADVGEDYYNFTIHKWFFKDVFDASGVNLEVEIIEEDKPSEEIRKLQSEIDILTNKVEQYYSEVISFRDKTRYLKDKLNELGDKK